MRSCFAWSASSLPAWVTLLAAETITWCVAIAWYLISERHAAPGMKHPYSQKQQSHSLRLKVHAAGSHEYRICAGSSFTAGP